MTFGVSSYFPAEFGLAKGVDAQRPATGWYAPGPYVQIRDSAAAHPVFYGYNGQKTIPVRWADGPAASGRPSGGACRVLRLQPGAAAGAGAFPGW